jgi:hypothetical protein
MARVAVIGEPLRIHLYGLTGAILCPAIDQAEAVLAWRDMPDDIEVAVLTPSAARWLASEIARRPGVLPVLLPEKAADGPMNWPDFLPGPRQAAGPLGADGLPDPGALPDPGGLPDPGAPDPGAPPGFPVDPPAAG